MPEERTNAEQTQLASAVPQKLPEAKKIRLAVAIAEGESVAVWARENGVHRGTAFRWAREPSVRRAVEACRRRTLDQAIGRTTNLRFPFRLLRRPRNFLGEPVIKRIRCASSGQRPLKRALTGSMNRIV